VRDCDDDVAAEISGRLEKGAGADFKMPALKKAKASEAAATAKTIADLERQIAALKGKG
jgi:hypothetical protein